LFQFGKKNIKNVSNVDTVLQTNQSVRLLIIKKSWDRIIMSKKINVDLLLITSWNPSKKYYIERLSQVYQIDSW